MSKPVDDRIERVRAAALVVFGKYGYRRSTMADIAAAAAMSRPALYLVFCNKEAIFRDLAVALVGGAVDAAAAAWPETGNAAEGLASAILAKDLELFRLIGASPHGIEILSESRERSADLHDELAARFHDLVERRLASAGFGDAAARARMLVKAADGLKHAGGSEADYVADVRALAAATASRPPSG